MGNDQNRAILDGCWSPVREKFCFGTGSYKIYVGYVDSVSDWWVAELLSRKSKYKKFIKGISKQKNILPF